MLNKDSKGAADRFIEKLMGKKFTMPRSQNTSENYDVKKQKRDSNAVDVFTKTEFYKEFVKEG